MVWYGPLFRKQANSMHLTETKQIEPKQFSKDKKIKVNSQSRLNIELYKMIFGMGNSKIIEAKLSRTTKFIPEAGTYNM
jgi:hypothetical protein